MADIAAELGLSRSTVSFVLNGRADIQIPDETRKRVLVKAAEMGYRRHAAARSLASRRTDLIGVITDIGSGPFAGDILMGAQQAAWATEKFLLVVGFPDDGYGMERAVEALLERRVEGLIIATQAHVGLSVPSIALEVPTVLVHCFDEQRALPTVLPDERAGGFAAAEYLFRAGHRRIAMINLPASAAAAEARELGFVDAHRSNKVEVDGLLVRSGDATATSGYEVAAELLALAHPPTAIFCANDRMAMGAYDAIRDAGLRVPRDVSVVGFDNQDLIAPYLRPPLTSVALPFRDMGARAIQLMEETTHGVQGRDAILDCPIIVRDSVA